ncbi:hypothetical protein V6N12_037925 [Hibiscus sabdariffa]|uniref:Inhibitor I9 domain-containing protein n=1 Tax=Hibiscus sabdariffa TaxID=183260 RepID=A0ABR2B054_9ROSI
MIPSFASAFLCLATAYCVQGSPENERKPYIVYMGEVAEHGARLSVMDEHHQLLLRTVGDEDMARESKIYSYGKSINGFAARLLPDEAKRLADLALIQPCLNMTKVPCDSGTLGKNKVKGKIVYCLGDSSQDHTIRMLDGAGTIVAIDEPSDNYLLTLIPATYVVRSKNGDKLDRYINSTRNPHAVIYKTKTVHMAAPFVASFSSRGPQLTNPNILKVKSIFSLCCLFPFTLASNSRLSMASPT